MQHKYEAKNFSSLDANFDAKTTATFRTDGEREREREREREIYQICNYNISICINGNIYEKNWMLKIKCSICYIYYLLILIISISLKLFNEL